MSNDEECLKSQNCEGYVSTAKKYSERSKESSVKSEKSAVRSERANLQGWIKVVSIVLPLIISIFGSFFLFSKELKLSTANFVETYELGIAQQIDAQNVNQKRLETRMHRLENVLMGTVE